MKEREQVKFKNVNKAQYIDWLELKAAYLRSNSVLPEGEIRSQCASPTRQSYSYCIFESHKGSFHDPFMSPSI